MINDEKNQEISSILNEVPAYKIAAIESLLAKKDSKIISLEKELSWFKGISRNQ